MLCMWVHKEIPNRSRMYAITLTRTQPMERGGNLPLTIVFFGKILPNFQQNMTD